MAKFALTCTYCGHNWRESFYNETSIKHVKCPKQGCGYPRIRARQCDETVGQDVFGYRFSPDFPKKDPPQPQTYSTNWGNYAD